jgi:pyruvate formate lyase activating enzyme
LIWFEFILDAAAAVKEKGLKNVIVSNGYINDEPLEELLPLIDAANIDLKSMSPEFYKKICKGRLEPVKNTIESIFKAGKHLEVTNLVIPGLNDSVSDFERLTDFVAGMSDHIPLHFSAYYPTYKMNRPRTPAETLLKAYEIASRKIKFVYLGNVNIPGKSDTICPGCGEILIKRDYYNVEIRGLSKNRCSGCGYETGIVY